MNCYVGWREVSEKWLPGRSKERHLRRPIFHRRSLPPQTSPRPFVAYLLHEFILRSVLPFLPPPFPPPLHGQNNRRQHEEKVSDLQKRRAGVKVRHELGRHLREEALSLAEHVGETFMDRRVRVCSRLFVRLDDGLAVGCVVAAAVVC